MSDSLPPHSAPAPFWSSSHDCVSRFAHYYAARTVGDDAPPAVTVSRDGPYALVAWEYGAGGGMDLFRRRGAVWCHIDFAHHVVDVGGSFDQVPWLHEADIVDLDDVGRARARRLFRGMFVAETLRAR